jgi:predicted dehydrogenase
MPRLDAGLDVICDKPLINDLETSRDLVRLAEQKGGILMVTYNYSGYPMIREARAAVAAGKIGTPHLVHVTYAQGSLGQLVETEPDLIPGRIKWRLDKSRGDEAMCLPT